MAELLRDPLIQNPPLRMMLPGAHLWVAETDRLILDSGLAFGPFNIAYRTYGTLNADKSNAILVCHALTGDQYLADDTHPITGKPGWWRPLVGPGKLIDTDKFFVICANVLGGCLGSTGPADINPATGKAYGLEFPMLTIGDMVKTQVILTDHLGIGKLFAVIGGSMGGMQALEWARRYPEKVGAAVIIASSYRHTAQNIAFHEVGRQAVMADPKWCGGRYPNIPKMKPDRGLAVARMTAHITYLSEPALHRKFGRKLQEREAVSYSFDSDFQVESYLNHQGRAFVERFDANSYLYLTRTMDYFDLSAEQGGRLSEAFRDSPVRFCLISFSSDWCFPTSESRYLAHALNAAGANVSCVEVQSDAGHDAFLLDEPDFHRVMRGFLQGCADGPQGGGDD